MGTAGSVAAKPLKSKRLVEKTIKTEKKLETLDTKHYDKVKLSLKTLKETDICTFSASFDFQDNMHLLRDMFVGLDPTMRVYMEEDRGQVQISNFYDRHLEILKIKIHQVRDMKPSNIRADTCDAYFKVD